MRRGGRGAGSTATAGFPGFQCRSYRSAAISEPCAINRAAQRRVGKRRHGARHLDCKALWSQAMADSCQKIRRVLSRCSTHAPSPTPLPGFYLPSTNSSPPPPLLPACSPPSHVPPSISTRSLPSTHPSLPHPLLRITRHHRLDFLRWERLRVRVDHGQRQRTRRMQVAIPVARAPQPSPAPCCSCLVRGPVTCLATGSSRAALSLPSEQASGALEQVGQRRSARRLLAALPLGADAAGAASRARRLRGGLWLARARLRPREGGGRRRCLRRHVGGGERRRLWLVLRRRRRAARTRGRHGCDGHRRT